MYKKGSYNEVDFLVLWKLNIKSDQCHGIVSNQYSWDAKCKISAFGFLTDLGMRITSSPCHFNFDDNPSTNQIPPTLRPRLETYCLSSGSCS